MARTSSLSCLSCRNLAKPLIRRIPRPVSLKTPFFNEKCFCRIPFPKVGSYEAWQRYQQLATQLPHGTLLESRQQLALPWKRVAVAAMAAKAASYDQLSWSLVLLLLVLLSLRPLDVLPSTGSRLKLGN